MEQLDPASTVKSLATLAISAWITMGGTAIKQRRGKSHHDVNQQRMAKCINSSASHSQSSIYIRTTLDHRLCCPTLIYSSMIIGSLLLPPVIHFNLLEAKRNWRSLSTNIRSEVSNTHGYPTTSLHCWGRPVCTRCWGTDSIDAQTSVSRILQDTCQMASKTVAQLY